MNRTKNELTPQEIANIQNLLVTHLSNITCLCLCEKHKIVATGSSERVLKLWNLCTGLQIRVLNMNTQNSSGMVFINELDSLIVSSGSYDSTLTSWNIPAGQMQQISKFPAKITSISLSHNESILVLGAFDGFLQLVNTTTFQPLYTLLTHFPIFRVLNSLSYIIYCAETKASALPVAEINKPVQLPIKFDSNALFSSYSDTIFWTSYSEIQYFDINSQNSGQLSFHKYRIVALTAKKHKFASVSSDSELVVWDFLLKSQIWSVNIGTVAKHINLFEDTNKVICGNIYRLVVLASNSSVTEFCGHTFEIICWDLSANGAFLVTGSRDCTVRVWDALSYAEVYVFKEHSFGVSVVCFSRCEKFILSGSIGGKVIVWNFHSKSVEFEFGTHFVMILGVLRMELSQRMIVWDQDGGVLVFDLGLKESKFLHREGRIVRMCITTTKTEKYSVCCFSKKIIRVFRNDPFIPKNLL